MAYVIAKPQGVKRNLPYLPMELEIQSTKQKVHLDWFKDSDFDSVYSMMKSTADEGLSYPQTEMSESNFRDYYLSHDAFVLRSAAGNDVLGSFYVKPNFPGRSSHICNAGFLVNTAYRKQGIGELLFKKYLRIAKDLGYEGSFFNLVYASNTGSLKICRRLGFTEVGIVPKAGKMKGIGTVDAVQFYYDLTTLNGNGEPAWGWPS